MPEEPNPFPTITKLANEFKGEWPNFQAAADRTAHVERIFKAAIQAEAPGGRVLDTDSSLVLFGSFARHELVPGSDCDWTLLVNGVVNTRHADDARLVHRALKNAARKEMGLNAPSAGGAFGNLCFSHDMVHKIGGGADSNENLTRRILMLLESRAVSLSQADSASIFGAYDTWLGLLGDEKKRGQLERIGHIEADGDQTFQEVRRIGAEFAKGLKLLFFGRYEDEDLISNLSLEYVGF